MVDFQLSFAWGQLDSSPEPLFPLYLQETTDKLLTLRMDNEAQIQELQSNKVKQWPLS